MKFSTRIFLAYFLLVGLGTALFLNSAADQLRPAIRQASEEAVVDAANLLAEVVAPQFSEGFGPDAPFPRAMTDYRQRTLNAQIWSLLKTEPDFAVYITDLNGRVLYHSEKPEEVGADYSRWIDVSRTLRGEYGARTTRTDPDDELTSSMYVAAPIVVNGDRVGILTLSQPNASIQPFLSIARRQMWQQGTAILLLALLLGGLMSMWLARSVGRLSDYVEKVRHGERVSPPQLRERELANLAQATERMRREIEGRQYVEQYIHTLAHEMKSPLSAIRGAAELLQEMPLANPDAGRFLANIDHESSRMQRLIDRLLSLATLEKRHELEQTEQLDLAALVRDQIDSKYVALQQKGIHTQLVDHGLALPVVGERFFLEQGVSNLLDNAIEFSPPQGEIRIFLQREGDSAQLRIVNDGDPIPSYAIDKVFDRFYSLPRPDGDRKSTGLGLTFVRAVANLHGGRITLRNAPEGGVEALLSIPLSNQTAARNPKTSRKPSLS